MLRIIKFNSSYLRIIGPRNNQITNQSTLSVLKEANYDFSQ